MGKRIEWVSVLQGLAIVLVVMGHVNLPHPSTGEPFSVVVAVRNVVFSFHMPLFVFLSGGLLWKSRLDRGASVKTVYRQRLERLAVPWLFFTVVAYGLKPVFNAFVKRPVKPSLHDFLTALADPFQGPMQELWFLQTLLLLTAFYPLYRWVCRQPVREVLFGLFTVVFYFVDLRPLCALNVFQLFTLNLYLPFFFLGIVAFRHRLYLFLDGWDKVLASFLFFLFCYVLSGSYGLTALAGIMLSVSLCRNVSRHVAGLFSSFRDHVYQIYLFGIFFQVFVELFLWPRFGQAWLFPLFYAGSVLSALYGSVWLSRLLRRLPSRWLRRCVGW